MEVKFNQTIISDSGKIQITLSGVGLPSSFNISLGFTYTASQLTYGDVSFSGSSIPFVKSLQTGSNGIVSITGMVQPSSQSDFATLTFEGSGNGTFNLNVSQLTINGVNAVFADPPPINYSITPLSISQDISLTEDGSTLFTVNPLNEIFAPINSIKQQPQHGSLKKSTDIFSLGSWIYTPDHDFNGIDQFSFTISSGNTVKDVNYKVTVIDAIDELVGSINSDTLVDATGNSNIYGLAGNDRLIGGSGADTLDGGQGIDVAVFSLSKSNYLLTRTGSNYKIEAKTGSDGTDTLIDIERLQFSDINIALDMDGNAGKVAKILAAVFGASAVSNKEYAGIGLNLLDGGMSYDALAALAINAAGVQTREAIVNLLWTNLMGSHPTAEQAKPFVDMLASDLSNVGSLGVLAADYAAIIGTVNLNALSQSGLEYS